MRAVPDQRMIPTPCAFRKNLPSEASFISIFGYGIQPEAIERQRKILSGNHIDSIVFGSGAESLTAKKLISQIAPRLTRGSNLLLHIHGYTTTKGSRNQHWLSMGKANEHDISTVKFLTRLLTRATQRNKLAESSSLPLPIIHIMSCYAGVLSDEIRPEHPLWSSAHFIVYSNNKIASPYHYEAALKTIADYTNDCAAHGKPVNPLRSFYLGSSRRGDCMRLLGGDLRASLVLHAPKMAADLSDDMFIQHLEGKTEDKIDFSLSAIETIPDEDSLKAPLAQALSTLLQTRIFRKDLVAVRQLLDEHPALVNQATISGALPINTALLTGSMPIIELFLEKGVNLSKTDSFGVGPVMTSLSRRDPALIRRLLSMGGCPNEIDHEGSTPLLVAANCGCHAEVRTLLEGGADINYADDGDSALSLAVGAKDIAMVELLLAYHPGPNGGLSQALAGQARAAGQTEIARLLEAALPAYPQD